MHQQVLACPKCRSDEVDLVLEPGTFSCLCCTLIFHVRRTDRPHPLVAENRILRDRLRAALTQLREMSRA